MLYNPDAQCSVWAPCGFYLDPKMVTVHPIGSSPGYSLLAGSFWMFGVGGLIAFGWIDRSVAPVSLLSLVLSVLVHRRRPTILILRAFNKQTLYTMLPRLFSLSGFGRCIWLNDQRESRSFRFPSMGMITGVLMFFPLLCWHAIDISPFGFKWTVGWIGISFTTIILYILAGIRVPNPPPIEEQSQNCYA